MSRINYSIWLYIKIKTITFNRKSFYASSFAYFTTYACYVHFFLHGTIMVKIYFLLHNFYCQKIFFLENEQFIISQYLFFSDSLFLFPRLTCIEKSTRWKIENQFHKLSSSSVVTKDILRDLMQLKINRMLKCCRIKTNMMKPLELCKVSYVFWNFIKKS